MKKLILLATILSFGFLFSAYTQAEQIPQDQQITQDQQIPHDQATNKSSPFGGFYLGLGVGGSYNTGKVDNTYTDIQGNNSTPTQFNLSGSLNNFSAAGNLFLGFGGVFNNIFYIGGEGSFLITPTSYKISNNQTIGAINGSSSAEMNTAAELGAGIRAGVLINPNLMIYGMLTADLRFMGVNTKHSSDILSDSYDNYETVGSLFGLTPSIGIEYMPMNNISIRGQYSLYYYGSETYNGTGNLDFWGNATQANEKVSGVSSNVFLVQVAYHFHSRSFV